MKKSVIMEQLQEIYHNDLGVAFFWKKDKKYWWKKYSWFLRRQVSIFPIAN